MEHIRLFVAKQALETYIKFDGKMEITRGMTQKAIKNVIEPITGKTYKRSMAGKHEALADCLALLGEEGV